MDKLTIDRIKTLHPNIRTKAEVAYREANNVLGKGCRLRFSQVYRTEQEQNDLFAKRPKVTNAKAWQSMHNYGLAFDIVVLYDMDNNGTFEVASWDLTKDLDADGKADWKEAIDYLKSQGFEHGGDWKFKDVPHFQMTFGYTWQQLYEKFKANDFIPGTKFVNL